MSWLLAVGLLLTFTVSAYASFLSPASIPTSTSVVALAATPTATPAATNWLGEYYANVDLQGSPSLVREDLAIDFDWRDGVPVPGLPAEGFSVRWWRVATFEEGLYDFYATMDDGMRVYVDGELLIDEWRDEAKREVKASRHMLAGNHTLRVEYYDRRYFALAHLWWEKQRSYAGWKALYWANRDLQGVPVLVRDDPQVSFDWQMGSPGEGVPSDQFSVRWTRTMRMEEGTYQFYAFVDDGVRVWVDDQRVIDAWYDHELHGLTGEYVLGGAGEHTLVVEYYDNMFDAKISVGWQRIGQPSYAKWKGEYFANPTLSGDPVLVRDDRSLNFAWEENAPAPNLPTDGFSVRWTREKEFEPGRYRFRFRVDDGVRFYVDDERVLNEWHQTWGETYEVDVDLSGEHDLKVEIYENTGDARIEFHWERIDD
jgi:hypothetical protein